MNWNGLLNYMILFLCLGCASPAFAQEAGPLAASELAAYLPANNEEPGWNQEGQPRIFRGEELFMMINGGADIYHEYGFSQVLAATYADANGKSIKLEIYEMKNPAAAWGMFTFKTGADGKAMDLGQGAVFEDYYLNFWKGNLLVTVIGSDPEESTRQALFHLAKAVDARILKTGKRPALADLLLEEPHAFSHPQYLHGILGVMHAYIFDTQNIFQVKKGMAGSVDGCRALVFAYADKDEAAAAFSHGTEILKSSQRFTDRKPAVQTYTMVDRDKNAVHLQTAGRYIIAAIGQNETATQAVAVNLAQKLLQN